MNETAAGRKQKAVTRGSSESLAPIVQALRNVDLIVAVTSATEVGDVQRFDNPRQLIVYLGIVPEERSSGETVRRGGITTRGNGAFDTC